MAAAVWPAGVTSSGGGVSIQHVVLGRRNGLSFKLLQTVFFGVEKIVSTPVSSTSDFPVVLCCDSNFEMGVWMRGGGFCRAEGEYWEPLDDCL